MPDEIFSIFHFIFSFIQLFYTPICFCPVMRMFRGQTLMCPSNKRLSDQLFPSFLRREQREEMLCVHNTERIASD